VISATHDPTFDLYNPETVNRIFFDTYDLIQMLVDGTYVKQGFYDFEELGVSADKMRVMSDKSVHLNQLVRTFRDTTVNLVATWPDKATINKDLLAKIDFVIEASENKIGRAEVRKVHTNPKNGDVYTMPWEDLTWEPIDHLPI